MKHHRLGRIILSLFLLLCCIIIGLWLAFLHTPLLETSVHFDTFAPATLPDGSRPITTHSAFTALKTAHPSPFKPDITQLHFSLTMQDRTSVIIIGEEKDPTSSLVCNKPAIRKQTPENISYCQDPIANTVLFQKGNTALVVNHMPSSLTDVERERFIDSFVKTDFSHSPVTVSNDPMTL